MPTAKTREMFGVTMSESCAALLERAAADARERGHLAISSEHVLWALLGESKAKEHPERVRGWLEERGVTSDKVVEFMKGEDMLGFFWMPHDQPYGRTVDFGPSEALKRALSWASAIYGDSGAEVTSELLIGGLLAEGANVAARVIDDIGFGSDVTLRSLLEALGLGEVTLPTIGRTGVDDSEEKAGVGEGEGKAADGKPAAAAAWTLARFGETLPEPKLAPLEKLPAIDESASAIKAASRITGPSGSTERFAWLIHGAVMMGPAPSSSDLRGIVSQGVTTFVDLRHESRGRPGYMYSRSDGIAAMQKAGDVTHRITYMHFPIYDFDAVDSKDMLSLVHDIAERVHRGEVLYIHCAGGHGRTGTVTINVLSALYKLPMSVAWRHAAACHAQRAGCGEYCAFPEEQRQLRQIYALSGSSSLPRASDLGFR